MVVIFSPELTDFFILTWLAKSPQKSPETVECYLTSTNHVRRSKCNGIEVHIRRVINSLPNFIECNDVFDARIISLKHQYPVKQLEYGIDLCRISETDGTTLHISTENHMLITYIVAFVLDLIQKRRVCFTSARPSQLVTDQWWNVSQYYKPTHFHVFAYN